MRGSMRSKATVAVRVQSRIKSRKRIRPSSKLGRASNPLTRTSTFIDSSLNHPSSIVSDLPPQLPEHVAFSVKYLRHLNVSTPSHQPTPEARTMMRRLRSDPNVGSASPIERGNIRRNPKETS